MKQFVLGCLFIFVLAGCIPQIMPNQSGQPARQQEVEPVDLGSMSLKALFTEYNQNKVAADKKYFGKAIRVNGVVASIGESLSDGYTVRIKENGWKILCFFEDSQESDILALKDGQKITVFGVITKTYGDPHPNLEKCRIVKP